MGESMQNRDVYRLLGAKLPSYLDYAEIPVQPNDEALLPIPTTANLTTRQIDQKMLPYTGSEIYVRKTVLEKLLQVADMLRSENAELILEVVYGYRTLEIQTMYFEQFKEKLKKSSVGQNYLKKRTNI